MKLTTLPRNAIGDRAGPRYQLQTFHSPKAAIPILRQLFARLDADQERFILLALNNKLNVTGFKIVSSGGMADTIVDRRIVFRSALLLGATSVIAAHNHPSGDSTPSLEDRALTRHLVAAGELLDLQVHDHLILARDTYSFAERGELR